MIIELDGKKLSTDGDDFWVAPNATVIGNVIMEKDSSIWFQCTIRGDNEPITIGAGSNIQDNSVIHTDPGCPCTIGSNVTVGHMAMLHGCQIGDGSLIGIGAVILNNAKIGSLVMGIPGKIKKELDAEEQKIPQLNAGFYVENYKRYKAQGI
jgi:carbonic anhydrase/acetyltransferase-like protein (isoleucine patch superfamily)